MRTIRFRAEGQTLERASAPGNPIIAGSKGGYLRCKFQVDDEWADEDMMIAAFYGGDGLEHALVLDDELSCAVPDEVTDFGTWKVALVGVIDTVHIKTNAVAVRQEVAR